jgi:DNA-directed RNA polymerase specialized sigma24 family protein
VGEAGGQAAGLDHLSSTASRALAGLRREAARASRRPEDTDDLLGDALLAAVRAGRADLTDEANLRWLSGTIRQLGAMHARTALRRRLRDDAWSAEHRLATDADTAQALADAQRRTPAEWAAHPSVRQLPPALRVVTQLALGGHHREEIAWLLRLDSATLRQRISALRKRLRSLELDATQAPPNDPDQLPLGLLRRALLPVVRAGGGVGTTDPDGHLLVFGTGEPHVQASGGNK